MTTEDIAKLKSAGIDYLAGIKRFMDDSELYTYALSAFLKDDLLERSKTAYDNKNMENLFDCAHECKGSSGNLDMTDLFNASCVLVELLRNDKNDNPKVQNAFNEYVEKYELAINCLQTIGV